ncbi:putative Nucleolar transcription factor 1 [Hypsibius exemplaris]|uniref:Nucleolar transcription factor 1 n=1 Tax=Hypsibius exemplaris TaxID=2072580 RepID=A0A1W0WTG0_HYPEX|nr:putative Nucleolar transcription factor 1 [Hypsibius exemplaris]
MGDAEDGEENRVVLDWPVRDVKQLLAILQAKLPKKDNIGFQRRIRKVKWGDITVGDHSSEECRTQFERLIGSQRTFRILEEIVRDAVTWVEDPGSSKAKEKDHPDFPKKPIPSYMKFHHEMFAKVKARNPELTQADLSKKVTKRWNKLSDEERAVYNAAYQDEMLQFKRRKAEFFAFHPEFAQKKKGQKGDSETAKSRRGQSKRPSPPKTPFDHYVESRLSADASEAEKKEQKEALKVKWADMSDKRKAKYIELSLGEQKEYEEKLEEFRVQHPDAPVKRRMKCVTQADLDVLGEAYGRPKAPAGHSGYNLFCSEFRGKGDIRGWMAKSSAEWKLLSPEQKAVYTDRSKAALKEYHKACEVYLAGLPEEKRDDERKVLKYEPQPSTVAANGSTKKRRRNEADCGIENKKRKSQNESSPVSAVTFYMLEEREKFQKKFPEVKDANLKQLMTLAFDKLPDKEKKRFHEMVAKLAQCV